MLSLHRQSTLFPYTTLFRSQGRRHPLAGDVAYDQAHLAVLEAEKVVEISSYLSSRLVVVGYLPALEDRKSTRLNSSHLVISYAVFCLKKKTIIYSSL